MTDIRPETIPITDLPDASPSNPLEALSWLGDTVEEIAEGLRARKAKGVRFDSTSCVLAVYLQEWWPGSNFACGTAWINGDLTRDYEAPDVFADFEDLFDDGAFPDLIDNG